MAADSTNSSTIGNVQFHETTHGGSPASLATLFERHRRELFRFLLQRLRNEEDAEDALQETFLRASRHHASGKLSENARAYLFTTAANLVVDAYRRGNATSAGNVSAMPAVVDLPLPEDVEDTVRWKQNLDRLLDSLEELPGTTQQVFLLYHARALSYKEIASIVGVTTRTVERHMAAALKHVKARLGCDL